MVKRKSVVTDANQGTEADETVLQDATEKVFSKRTVRAAPKRKPAAKHINEASSVAARGKDVLAREAGGLATVVAIGVGAALIEIELIPGLIIGAGAILLGKLFPEVSDYVRPAVKSMVKLGFSMTEKARGVIAEANEQAHDLVAEVRHERTSSAVPVKKARPQGKAGSVGNGLAATH